MALMAGDALNGQRVMCEELFEYNKQFKFNSNSCVSLLSLQYFLNFCIMNTLVEVYDMSFLTYGIISLFHISTSLSGKNGLNYIKTETIV